MRARRHLLVYLFYLAVTLVITFPLITVIGTRMIGHPLGDAYEYTHHIWWIKTALQTGQNPFYMPNLLYPDGLAAPLLWSLPLQSFPAWLFAFVMPLPAAFNIAALLTLALNGWAMFFLVRYLIERLPLTPNPSPTRAGRGEKPIGAVAPLPYVGEGKAELRSAGVGLSFPSALIAGLVFMLYPTFQGQLGAAHVGLLTLYPAPLFLYMLLRLRHVTRALRTMLAGALLFVVSLWGSVLLLIYLIAPITAIYVLMLAAAKDWRALRRALATVALGAVFALPFVVPLALNTLSAPLEEGSVRYSASLLGVVTPSFYHPLFSQWTYTHRVLGLEPFETASYVGVIAAALALIAVWKTRQARWWLLLALIAWVFSLGPLLKLEDAPLTFRIDGYASSITLPWALFQNLPLIDIARTPARFDFAVGFAVAVMAGYGAAVAGRALRGQSAALDRRRNRHAADRLRVPVLVVAADHPRQRAAAHRGAGSARRHPRGLRHPRRQRAGRQGRHVPANRAPASDDRRADCARVARQPSEGCAAAKHTQPGAARRGGRGHRHPAQRLRQRRPRRLRAPAVGRSALRGRAVRRLRRAAE